MRRGDQPAGIWITRRIVVLGGAVSLSGCSSIVAPKNTIINVRLVSDLDINPSPTGAASPVAVRLYVLHDGSNFSQSDFQSLYTADTQTLGTALISKRETIVPPGATEVINEEVAPDAAALGVLAAFRTIDTALWRAVAPLQPGSVNDIQISLSGAAVQVVSVRSSARPLL